MSIDTYDMQETLYQQEINKSQLTGNKATAGIGNHCLVHRVEMVDLDIIIRRICACISAYDTVSDVVESKVHQCQQNSDA